MASIEPLIEGGNPPALEKRISKVDYFGRTLIDLTKDTVTAASLLQGITAHDKAGNAISGTASGPKPEQEKEITISENGDYPITPDVGKVLSKVLAHVNVSGGGGGDISPFKKVNIKTWIPAQNTREYKVEGDTSRLVFLDIWAKAINTPALGLVRYSVLLQSGNSYYAPYWGVGQKNWRGQPGQYDEPQLDNGNAGAGYNPKTGVLTTTIADFRSNYTYVVLEAFL